MEWSGKMEEESNDLISIVDFFAAAEKVYWMDWMDWKTCTCMWNIPTFVGCPIIGYNVLFKCFDWLVYSRYKTHTITSK